MLARYRYRLYPDAVQRQMLARTFGCARVVFNDAGWSTLVRLIGEKSAFHGRHFARVGRFEPASQACSACGEKDGPKPLAVRTWACPQCGTVHDRDVNAAKNVLALGQRARLNASGGSVRPGQGPAAAGERGTRRSAA